MIIDNGEICGIGTHDMLLNGNKIYRRLYEAEAYNFNKSERQFNMAYN
ncbi:hypothetical protein PGH24_03265 [Thermoanaerobacterium thermosaccharolyticum]|nr:hypothetical protein PGH24_03265 [Thermoanaerobacterium thermosaccharolyticum]